MRLVEFTKHRDDGTTFVVYVNPEHVVSLTYGSYASGASNSVIYLLGGQRYEVDELPITAHRILTQPTGPEFHPAT